MAGAGSSHPVSLVDCRLRGVSLILHQSELVKVYSKGVGRRGVGGVLACVRGITARGLRRPLAASLPRTASPL